MNANTTSNMELINKLQKFSLDERVIESSLKMKMESQPRQFVAKEQFKMVKPINKIYIPGEKDTLFWCFFIMKHGDLQYEMIDNKNIVVEKKNKIEYVEKIKRARNVIFFILVGFKAFQIIKLQYFSLYVIYLIYRPNTNQFFLIVIHNNLLDLQLHPLLYYF